MPSSNNHCLHREPLSCELALGMDATLEATQRELAHVRAILSSAVEGLMVEFGARAVREGVVALQFQALSDRLLANAQRRIEMLRAVLGKEIPAPEGSVGAAPRGGGIDFL
jgi:hypothetical protein